MRNLGLGHMYDQLIPMPPDTVQTLLLAANVGQAMDWQTSTGAVANAAAADVNFCRVSAFSSLGSTPLNIQVNLFSTMAASPSSGTTIGSSGVSHPVNGQGWFRVPSSSTGWSACSISSGYVQMEQWRAG